MVAQAVADLLWVINSPAFVADADDVLVPGVLTADQIDGERLDAFLGSPRPYRVGRYFESLVHFWMRHVCDFEIEGHGVQVLDGKRTIGEADFLFRDHDGVLHHCEAAVKFFLHQPREIGSHFPGPNASDDFEAKTTKLFEQQLALSEKHFPAVTYRQAFIKGMLFYRDGSTEPTTLPDRMNPEHQRGVWMRYQDRVSDQRSDQLATIAPKPYWLAPQIDASLTQWKDLHESLSEHFSTGRTHPLMVSLRDPDSGDETERCFVVSESWPD